MIQIVQGDLPKNWNGDPWPESMGDLTIEKTYDSLHPRDMPDFFAQIGRIEGCFERFRGGSFWFDGKIALTITKGAYSLEGLICNYEGGVGMIDDEEVSIPGEIEKIEAEVKKLSSSFDTARNFKVTFNLTQTLQMKGKEVGFEEH